MLPRRLFLAALPLLAATSVAAQSGSGAIAGEYTAQGRNPDGTSYTGLVRIEQAGAKVSIAWKVGDSTYAGSGLIDGRVVEVDWGDNTPIVYVVMQNGELHGTWAGGRALERLVRR